MYTLKNQKGQIIRMKDGQPFEYSTERLAELGKSVLESSKRMKLRIVSP